MENCAIMIINNQRIRHWPIMISDTQWIHHRDSGQCSSQAGEGAQPSKVRKYLEQVRIYLFIVRFKSGPEYDTFAYLAPHASFLYKVNQELFGWSYSLSSWVMTQMILSNLWLLSGAVSSVLSASYETDAIQRTTTAVTMFNAGFKENVMPSSAEVIILLHLLVDSRDFWHRRSSTTGFIRQRRWKMLWSMIGPVFVLCHNDLGSNQGGDRWQQSGDIQKREQLWPSSDLPLWQRHHGLPSHCERRPSGLLPWTSLVTKDQVFPEGHIAPGTLIANTDTKHYQHLVDKIYRLQRYIFCDQLFPRFTPAFITKNDTKRFHGFNERISVENFIQTIEFYHRLIKNADTQVESS